MNKRNWNRDYRNMIANQSNGEIMTNLAKRRIIQLYEANSSELLSKIIECLRGRDKTNTLAYVTAKRILEDKDGNKTQYNGL